MDETERGFMTNETKKLHLAVGDIWNVQHEAWAKAIVTFEQNGTVYEVYVTPMFSDDINGLKVAFQVKLEYSLDAITQVTEKVSYDEVVKTRVISRLFE